MACAVKLSSTEVLLIGGFHKKKDIIKWDIKTNNLTSIGELQEGRYGHSCALIGDNIVIAGGKQISPGYLSILSSTEIISLDNLSNSRIAGQLNQERVFHEMVVTMINNEETLLAIGGDYVLENKKSKPTDSIEIWDPISETWTLSDTLKLSEAKLAFRALSVPTSLICP